MEEYFDRIKWVFRFGIGSFTLALGLVYVIMIVLLPREDPPNYKAAAMILSGMVVLVVVSIKTLQDYNNILQQRGAWRSTVEHIEYLQGRLRTLKAYLKLKDNELENKISSSITFRGVFPDNIVFAIKVKVDIEEVRQIIRNLIESNQEEINDHSFSLKPGLSIRIWQKICRIQPPYLKGVAVKDNSGRIVENLS